MRTLGVALATVFGIGYVPIAPGTFGSAAGLLLWWLLPAGGPALLLVVVGVFAVGAWSGGIAERHFNRTDPAPVVIDEVLGMLVTLVFNPVGPAGALIGFLLFRLADVVKPFPANRLEALHGGFGIMADDAMAGIYANLVLHGLILLARSLNWSL